MKLCNNCGKPITEYDDNFNISLGIKGDETCYQCRISAGKTKETIEKINKIRKELKIHMAIIIDIILIAIFVLLAFVFNDIRYDRDIFEILFYVWCGLAVIFGISIIRLIVQVFKVRREGHDYSDPEPTGYHYEVTETSDGHYKVTKEDDYSSVGAPPLLFIVVIFSVHAWYIPYVIYLLIKKAVLISKLPKEVQKACSYAEKNTQKYVIEKAYSDLYEDQYKMYKKKIDKIKDKYSVMGNTVVSEKINKIKEPYFTATINSQKYIIVDNPGKKWHDQKQYMLYRSKTSKKIEGVIKIGNYIVKTNSDNWQNDWAISGFTGNIENVIHKYEQCL